MKLLMPDTTGCRGLCCDSLPARHFSEKRFTGKNYAKEFNAEFNTERQWMLWNVESPNSNNTHPKSKKISVHF